MGEELSTESEDTVEDTMRETLASIETRETDSGDTAERAVPRDTSGDVNTAAVRDPKAPVDAAPPQAPAAEPWREPPKSWKKEMAEYWKRADPQVMQYVHQREQEALRGITQYKQVADRWGQVLKPYEQPMRQFNIDPYQAVSNLVAVHTVLRFGTPQQKQAAAAQLMKDYPDLPQLFTPQGAQGQQRGPDFTPYDRRLSTLEAEIQRRQMGEAESEVDRFIADTSNKYAAEALPKMLDLIENQRASNLKEAYELAVRTDPVLFDKFMKDSIEARIAAEHTPPARAPTNTRPSRVAPSTAGRSRGSIEDTMRETLNAMQNRT